MEKQIVPKNLVFDSKKDEIYKVQLPKSDAILIVKKLTTQNKEQIVNQIKMRKTLKDAEIGL